MPQTSIIPVTSLQLDLRNYRMLPQAGEQQALHAMASVRPKKLWGLASSLLADGFLPTENIIVLKSGQNGTDLVVMEGNRRVALLKLIHGILSTSGLSIPSDVLADVQAVSSQWKVDNQDVPCLIYDQTDAALVDRIVSRTHGKGDDASRDDWTAVATARHNRGKNGGTEIALDLLEAYLQHSRNVSTTLREKWSGDYPITVLEELLPKLSTRLAMSNSRALVTSYPSLPQQAVVDGVLHAIGENEIKFSTVRQGLNSLQRSRFESISG